MMAKKPNTVEALIVSLFAVIALPIILLTWLYETIGSTGFWFLMSFLGFGGMYYLFKKQNKQNPQSQSFVDWLNNGSNNSSSSQQQRTQTSNNDYFEELAIYTASSHVVYELSSDYGWNLSLLTFRQQEVLRSLQIIRESLNISAKTKKQDIAESRLSLAHQLYDEVCNNYSDVFKVDLLTRIKGIIDADLLNVHTEAYLNVANAHLDKALNAKRANTKAKYFGLAKEVLETGLSDPYSDKERIRELLAFNNRLEENI
ncbi:hypothetical protein [Agitococcus lubricus]|nr:hypothetical protein [Agitococcus lubricus]